MIEIAWWALAVLGMGEAVMMFGLGAMFGAMREHEYVADLERELVNCDNAIRDRDQKIMELTNTVPEGWTVTGDGWTRKDREAV